MTALSRIATDKQLALVTGGGSGIGEAIAHALAGRGCRVVICGRTEAKLKRVAESAPDGAAEILTHVCDVADRDAVAALIERCEGELGGLGVVVNAAGLNVPGRLLKDATGEEWDTVMAANATGPFNVLKAAVPAMKERGDGLCVNISSVAGVRALLLGGIPYAASKFACTSLGLALSTELKDTGVRVTNIYPGEVETPILDLRPEPPGPERRALMLQPEDVAAAVLLAATLPPRANVLELTIKPTVQEFV
ncbi:SDR family oxidoreductase [Alienimonas chondri]|uniref:Oxidoreductase n=1 Tax=Alienimonas chondri TaxID=2681879 RepID=A0ABX1VIE5_9PLAN|nr:SDR family oxidoreductase [Alienimonas chondri]NNJ27882.1 putative oxidoreductase [Alienimonas chondri]